MKLNRLKFIYIVVVLLLVMLSKNSLAESIDTENITALSLGQLKEKVKNSSQYQMLEIAEKNININKDIIEEGIDEINDQRRSLSRASSQVNSALSELEESEAYIQNKIDNLDPNDDDYADDLAALQGQLAQIEAHRNDLNAARVNISRGRRALNDAERQLERVKDEVERGQITLGVQKEMQEKVLSRALESMYFAYMNLSNQIQVQGEQVKFLEKLIETEKASYKSGFSTLNSIQQLELQLEQLNVLVESLTNEKLTLLSNIKLMAGIDLDAQIKLEEVKEFELAELNLEESLEKAVTEGYEVTLRKQDYQWKTADVDYFKNEEGSNSYEYKIAKLDREEAEIKLAQAKDNVRLNVVESYRQVQRAANVYELAVKELELAEETLSLAETRYKQKLIPSILLSQEYLELTNAEQKYHQSKIDYLNALQSFYMAEKGIIENQNF